MDVCREVVEELHWELGKGVSASDRLGCLSLALILLHTVLERLLHRLQYIVTV